MNLMRHRVLGWGSEILTMRRNGAVFRPQSGTISVICNVIGRVDMFFFRSKRAESTNCVMLGLERHVTVIWITWYEKFGDKEC